MSEAISRGARTARTRWRWMGFILIGIIAFILIGVLLFKPVVRRLVLDALNSSQNYHATLDEIDIHLWRGAYQIHKLKILKSSCKVPVPFLSADTVDLSIEWRQLLKGALVGEIELDRSSLNFVGADSKCAGQDGSGEYWVAIVKALFPVRINRFAISDSQVHYRDFESDPPINIFLKNVFGEATNLTNSLKVSQSLMANIRARGDGDRSGKFTTEIEFDPYAKQPTFELALKLHELHLPDLNDLMLAYASVDVKKGRLTVVSEISSKRGDFSGYVKPLLTDVEIIEIKKDIKNPLRLIWESIVSVLTTIFTNQTRAQIATRIPISGKFEDPETGLVSAIIYLAHNAYIKALEPQFEGIEKR